MLALLTQGEAAELLRLSERTLERLRVTGGRKLLDQHGVQRGARLLTEPDGRISSLAQLALHLLGLGRGHERPELDREAGS